MMTVLIITNPIKIIITMIILIITNRIIIMIMMIISRFEFSNLNRGLKYSYMSGCSELQTRISYV